MNESVHPNHYYTYKSILRHHGWKKMDTGRDEIVHDPNYGADFMSHWEHKDFPTHIVHISHASPRGSIIHHFNAKPPQKTVYLGTKQTHLHPEYDKNELENNTDPERFRQHMFELHNKPNKKKK